MDLVSIVKKAVLTGAAIIILGGVAAGCKREDSTPVVDNPPAIISYEIPGLVLLGNELNFKVEAADDKGLLEVYIELQMPDGFKKIPLQKTNGTWEGAYNLLEEGSYPYKVIAKDTKNQTDVENGSIEVKAKPIGNSFDFAKSLGLEADYLRDVAFDSNSKDLISYLASLPVQMRVIAERSGMLEDILADKKIDAKESVFFNRVVGSYQNEIKTMQPWLNQLPENEVTAALALNLRNFMDADYLKNERAPSLLSPAIFFADGIKRMYEDEILDPEAFKTGAINAYAATAVKNITNFLEIHNKAWEVANDPHGKYGPSPIERSIEEILHAGYFQQEAVGSTDKGQNAYLDMKLLWEQGSFEAKAALRIYARNMTREGRQGSAPQVRVPLTMLDAWSLGIESIGVVLEGHDVPTIPITDDDIKLLKARSSEPLLVVDVNGVHHLPLQWTRKSIVRSDVNIIALIYDAQAPREYKIADLKPY